MKQAIFPVLQIGICTFSYLCATSSKTLAQITSDGTVNTQINQNGNVAEITGGETRGSNLFHSFQDFSVPTGNEAFFNNANSISNIFSRVTGGNISNIDGLIRANGSAILFLINPAGIIFGENARLDLGGSFYGSTASSILFEDGEFSAADLETPPLLTVNAPIGLGFRDNPGNIEVQNSNLQVSSGQNLNLLGKDINIGGAYLEAVGGRVNLGAISTAAIVSFKENLQFNFDNVSLANIRLSNGAIINVNGTGGGEIEVNARNLSLTESSIFNAGISTNSSTIESQAGNITINVAESLALESASTIRNNVNLNGFGNAGDVKITAQNLYLADNSRLSSITQGNGNSGNIKLAVSDRISLENSTIQTRIQPEGIGNAGNIEITTTNLSLKGEAKEIRANLLADSAGNGDAGSIIINATENVSLESNSSINNKASERSGNAGDISINANSLLIDGRSFILNGNGDAEISIVNNIGNSGNTTINARFVALDNLSLINNSSFKNAIGEAGDITINTDSLSIAGGSNISSLTENDSDGGEININAQGVEILTGGTITTSASSDGNAGNITLNIVDRIVVDGENPLIPSEELRFTLRTLQGLEPFTGLFASTTDASSGNGGNININTGNLSLISGGAINTSTNGQGNAGTIKIDASERISLDGEDRAAGRSAIRNRVEANAVGDAGNIEITTTDLSLINGGVITASTEGQGNGGTIIIKASDSISLDGEDQSGFRSSILNRVEGSALGDAGNIEITTTNLSLINEGRISANIQDPLSQGNGGDIEIATVNLALMNGGRISASIEGQGNAGNIKINATNNISLDGEDRGGGRSAIRNRVEATGVGDAGNIEITTPNLSLTNGGVITASTRSQGNGGSILINASDSISLDGEDESGFRSSILNRVEGDAVGDAGNIEITTTNLSLTSGGRISASTIENSQGNAGDINITAAGINLLNNGEINVSALGQGNGGNIFIRANDLNLDRSSIFAVNQPSEINISANTNPIGGNVNLELTDNLILRNDSSISARAFQEADGGNLDIDARFIIAFPDGNNDILASAQQGQGGNISIDAESLFGI
ncbi:MAG: filamentous hemagglutinin N-terminal domain-containing protein [Pleurocapsa sp. MO_226.B13]|nr:filamentous hemagglutinin N-terminal domain-containing protein [Pleurocapsa sp. MO_226.B13]